MKFCDECAGKLPGLEKDIPMGVNLCGLCTKMKLVHRYKSPSEWIGTASYTYPERGVIVEVGDMGEDGVIIPHCQAYIDHGLHELCWYKEDGEFIGTSQDFTHWRRC